MTETDQDRRGQARWLILLAAVMATVYLCWLMLKPFVNVLMWAAVLTLTFTSLNQKIVARTGRPSLSAALSTLIVMLVIGAPMALVTWAIAREIMPAVRMLQSAIKQALDPNTDYTGPFMRWLGEHVDLVHLRTKISEQLDVIGSQLAGSVVGIVGDLVGIFIQSLLVVFVMFYLFRDWKLVRDALAGALPLRHRQTYEVLIRIREVAGASVNGVLVIAAIQGTLGGIAFAALGLPSATLWGVVMIFLSLIPIAGAFVVWIPAVLYLAVTGAWIKATILLVAGLFISLIDNVLRPRLVGKRAKLHELFIFFAVLGGLRVFGLIGLVLGPVVLAVALSLFEAFRHPEPSSPPHGARALHPGSADSSTPVPP
ncbi:MAG: AI-2E family transporter [Nannocystis sp.]|uniref:AI-2E family transporter n=1 Tax=Nannocystis sp. TaxID=1962667 RepID=UPI002426B6E4|nr:AI-2E family transporter [Nannocystis sp.]MBK9755969.1 AI-2E family transporter [Nannocystis sp.]